MSRLTHTNEATTTEFVLPNGTRVHVDRSVIKDKVWLVIEDHPGSDVDGARQQLVLGLSYADAEALVDGLLDALNTGGRKHPALATLPAEVCE